MPFLVDGYNLLHAMGLLRPQLGPDGLLKARLALLGRLAGALGAKSGEATVIFDAAAAPADAPTAFDHLGIHVRFADRKQSADDLIEEVIRTSSAPKQLTVVSDDRRLLDAARRRSCRALHCDDFLTLLEKRRRPAPQPLSEPKEKTVGLSETEAERWVREFGPLAVYWDLNELFPLDESEAEEP